MDKETSKKLTQAEGARLEVLIQDYPLERTGS